MHLISIIIPTYNEEVRIGSLLKYLIEYSSELVKEIIVIDGGSIDNTLKEAAKFDVKIVKSQNKGRSSQMNEASKKADGDILYFVHADTFPPNKFDQLIVKEVKKGIVAGCFTSIFDWEHPFLRFCNFFSRLPFWFCRGGGQTLFIKKKVFNDLSGFNEEMQLMEEYEFISRVRKEFNFSIINKNAITSARDYRKHGPFRLQTIYAYVFYLYLIGAPQEKMVNFLNDKLHQSTRSST